MIGCVEMEIRENIADETVDIEKLADLVAERVIERLNAPKADERAEEQPEETEVTEETSATEERAIDYSSFEERLAKLI